MRNLRLRKILRLVQGASQQVTEPEFHLNSVFLFTPLEGGGMALFKLNLTKNKQTKNPLY